MNNKTSLVLKRLTVAILFAIMSLSLIACGASGGNSVSAVADKETVTIKSLSLVPMTYEEVLKACNLLLVGTCEKVISSEPAEGYTAYSFTVNEVLGGNYEENEITFSIPIAKISFYGMIGTDDYLIGHRYLLPILQSELVCETTYTTGAFGLTLDLTEEKYVFLDKTIDIPKKENVLSYSAHVFNSIERPEPIRKEYTNEFEEFYDESAFICKMKVVRKYEGIGRDILHCKCLETYKGNTEDLYSFLEDGLISIAVRNGTAEEGSEYIIGFKGAGAYQISVRNAVQPVSEELLTRVNKQ